MPPKKLDDLNTKTEDELKQEAEQELENLLKKPSNAFLHERDNPHIEVPFIDIIDEAETVFDALELTEEFILQRLEEVYKYRSYEQDQRLEDFEPNIRGLKKKIDKVLEQQEEIGQGNDAYVVVDTEEFYREDSLNQRKVCYKFAKRKRKKEGDRNDIFDEAKIHQKFYSLTLESPNSVGTPRLLESIKLDQVEVIKMEYLEAKSIKDIEGGKGLVPDWIDIDALCDDFENLLELAHEQGLYHRDLHFGNVMISQAEEPPADGKAGYVIDFGRSDIVEEEWNPDKKEVYKSEPKNNEEATKRDFTDANNRVKLSAVRQFLRGYREKKTGE